MGSRVPFVAAYMTLKILLTARVVLVAAVFQPIVFTAIAGLLLHWGERAQPTLGAAFGVAVMGAWSAVLFFAGGLLTRERRQGTLEMLVAAPAPLLWVVLGACMATATLVVYSLVSTIAVAVLFFGVSFTVASPLALVAALAMTVVVMGFLGVALSALFVMYRQAGMFQNVLEVPIWLISGLLVPLSFLPVPVRAVGRLLPLTWANEALQRAVTGSAPVWPALLGCALVGCAYLLVGGVLLAFAERRARVLATLPLS